MSRATLGMVAKWVWVTAVLVFVVGFAIEKRAVILDALSQLPVILLIGSASLILVGKLGLVANMLVAARRFSIKLSWRDGYCIYNLTALAKYIPGSVWQFVSRIAMLRERKASLTSIRDSLLAEHAWVIGSAIALSVLLIWLSQPEFFSRWLAWIDLERSSSWRPLLTFVTVTLFGVLVAAAIRFRHSMVRLVRWTLELLPPVQAFPVLFVTWVSLGASLWVLLIPFLDAGPSFAYVVGVYCFAYFVGFLVPFAPAGLGVREAVLTLALAPYLSTDVTIFLVAANRLLYLGVEVLAASICALGGRRWRSAESVI